MVVSLLVGYLCGLDQGGRSDASCDGRETPGSNGVGGRNSRGLHFEAHASVNGQEEMGAEETAREDFQVKSSLFLSTSGKGSLWT